MSSYKKLSAFGEKKSEVDSLLPNILRIEDKTALIQNYKVVVIDVHADWCGPCKIISPLFSELFKKYNIPGVCILAKENVDLKLSPSIQVVPTFQFFLYGQLDSVISGADITLVENKIIELINFQPTGGPPNPPSNPVAPPPIESKVPPQLEPQFQYQQPPPPPPPSSPRSVAQTQNEGFQHAHQSRQQYYEKPAQLPMSLPIRRKA